MSTSTYKTSFGRVQITGQLVISQVDEGVIFGADAHRELKALTSLHLDMSRPYGHLSYRKYSYSIDPMVYRKAAAADQLAGIAVVVVDEKKREIANYERGFFAQRFEIFDDLREAATWLQTLLREIENKRNLA